MADLMSVILSISSQVVRGHVGNSAAVHALRAFGHEVWPLPTVILSNHPGHGAASGMAVPAENIKSMLDQLDAFNWLSACDAVMSGYFRDATQCHVVAELVARLKKDNPDLIYCCDPVLGDDPAGLYVAEGIAVAVRDELLPLADLVIPNRFELEWLSGMAAGDAESAMAASRRLGICDVVATSIPDGDGVIANLWVTRTAAMKASVRQVEGAPHGIGDLVSALILARKLAGDTPERALGLVTAIAAHVLAASRGRDELDLIAGLSGLGEIAPLESVAVSP